MTKEPAFNIKFEQRIDQAAKDFLKAIREGNRLQACILENTLKKLEVEMCQLEEHPEGFESEPIEFEH